MMQTNENSRGLMMTLFRGTALAALVALAACASDDAATADASPSPTAPEATTAQAPASSGGFFGTPAPSRFSLPPSADQGPPSVNSVPTTTPTPRSTEAEREEARRGLIADLANSRHTQQGARTVPVTVRPYVPTAAPAVTEETTPEPSPETIERLDSPPPQRPAEAAAPLVGPRPPAAIPTGN